MNSINRQFGKLMNKAPGDNSKVSVLLKDYEDADAILTKVHALFCLPLYSEAANFR
jgi:amphiphysin